MEEIMTKFSGNRVFSQLDLADAYLQLPLDESSHVQSLVLEQLHRGHLGIRRMKGLARLHFFWPGMNSDVETLVRQCNHCVQTEATPVKAPLVPWPNTGKAWSRVHIDIGEPRKGNYFIVIVDSFSKFMDAHWLTSITSQSVIAYLRSLFRILGPPDTLVSDNGRQFTSSEFAKLCGDLNIVHLRCAPYMPQNDGLAERMVRTIKSALDTSVHSLESIVYAYKYTPNSALEGEKSPNEVFFSRSLKTPFDVFKPAGVSHEWTPSQGIFKEQFDRHHGVRNRDFLLGEEVTIQLPSGRRVPATNRERWFRR
ncbi:uncharacterized protein K02A2.6-like [Galendromus occidentalis]|uniref:RNA-directed DNA polymerase n=1 Tax=Galendromus occidentalis TaxID=34638 RepID=A0AAJ6QXS2_9ACAR|nr:uncharacterized protein K02A2.6-like [Galendromus occidentalis]